MVDQEGPRAAFGRPRLVRKEPDLLSLPRMLRDEAAQEWGRVAGPLAKAGRLTPATRNDLALYCMAATLVRSGRARPVTGPMQEAMAAAERQLVSLCAAFGVRYDPLEARMVLPQEELAA